MDKWEVRCVWLDNFGIKQRGRFIMRGPAMKWNDVADNLKKAGVEFEKLLGYEAMAI